MEVPEKRKLSPSNFPCYPAAETDDFLGEPHSARSVINGSQSQALQSRRWRWRRSWALYLALFLYLTLPAVTASDNDWSLNCPEACTCKWIHGKKTAECRSAGFNSIPTDLSDEVQVLDLTGNIISTLTKDIFKQAGLLHLQRIFLKNCQIERIDRDAFRELRILIELDLSENKIRTLQMEGFETNTRLRELQLNDNPLNKLSGVEFPPLLFLSKLGLKNCQLSEFSKKSFANLVNLVELDLSGNKFRYISEELLQPLKKLKSLDLRDNPWRCDCRLKSFREWASANKLLQAGTKCADPGPVANFEWNILLSSNFACSPEIINLQVNGQPTEVAIVGDVGKEITLECLVRANPPADVRWVRDNVAVTNATASAQGKAYYVHISGDLERWVNLTIQNSHPGDGGEYTCVGENKGGSVEKNVTLNFQEVPSGAGVGTGMGNDPNGYHSRSWLWILISGLVGGAILILVILLVCFYSRRRRTNKSTRSLDLKTEAKLNGSVAGYTECPVQQQSGASKADGQAKAHELQIEHQVHQHHHQNVISLSGVSPEKHHHHPQHQGHPSTSSLMSSSSNTCLLSSGGSNYCSYPSCSAAQGSTMSIVSRPRGQNNPRMDGYEGLSQTEFELSDLMPSHHPQIRTGHGQLSYQNPYGLPPNLYSYHPPHQSPHYVPHPQALPAPFDSLSSVPPNCCNPASANLVLTSTSLPSPLPPASGPGVMGYGMAPTSAASSTVPHIPVHAFSTLPPPPSFVNSQSTQTTTTTRVLHHAPYYNYDYNDCADMSQF